MTKKLALVLFSAMFLASSMASTASAAALEKVLVLRPDTDHPFWELYEKAARAACNDFGCEVVSLKAGWDHFKMVEMLEEYLKNNPKPDMVYFQSFKKNGPDVIKVLEQYKTNGFLVNAGLDDTQTDEMGQPREKYKYWVGQMLPDDYGAGKYTAELLYNNAVKKGLDVDGKVYFVGVEGNIADGASIQRTKGLRDFIAEHPEETELFQVVQGKWDTEISRKMTTRLIERHGKAHVIWAAGDPVAKGIMLGVEDIGKQPGKDYLTAGVDWADYALEAIKAGKLEGSAGGHFMEGGWSIVVAYDYLNGVDFATAENNASLFSQMGLLSAENLESYVSKFGDEDFDKIDFKTLSRFENPGVKDYNFDITSFLN